MKRFKHAIALTIAAVFISLVPATAAQADPFNLELSDAVLDLGDLKKVKAIDSSLSDPPATLAGTVTGNAIAVPKAGFVFPPKSAEVSPGITAIINMEANNDIVGTFDAGSGRMDLTVSLKATVTVLGSNCVISPIDLVLSSETIRPYLGEPFATGIAGPGAVSASWANLPEVTGGGNCGIVGQLISGPGGIWMSQDINTAQTCITDPSDARCDVPPTDKPSAAPRIISGPESVTKSTTAELKFTKGASETFDVDGYDCSLDGAAFVACDSGTISYTGLAKGPHTFKVRSRNANGFGPEAPRSWSVTEDVTPPGTPELGPLTVTPKNKGVKAGKKVTLTAKVANIGTATATGVKICVSAPKKLVNVKKCVTVGSVDAGKTASAKFKVTVKKSAKKGKKAALKFTASGTDVDKKTATAKVKVK